MSKLIDLLWLACGAGLSLWATDLGRRYVGPQAMRWAGGGSLAGVVGLGLLGLAALLAQAQLLPRNYGPSPVLVAARDLPAGAVLTAADVQVTGFPRGSGKPTATRPEKVVGKRVRLAVRQGDLLTPSRLGEDPEGACAEPSP